MLNRDDLRILFGLLIAHLRSVYRELKAHGSWGEERGV